MEGRNNPPKISLAAARVNAGYDQTIAAVKLGVSTETLRNWEKGNTIPTYDKVMKICELYQYPADYIFFGKALA
jgi:DNA-binding XRE family transcriptional regulator